MTEQQAETKRPRITLGVTGGVAAYKAAELVRTLQQQGADVHVVMTRAAQEFVRPLTFSSLTGHKVITSLWSEPGEENEAPTGLDADGAIEHIAEAQSADAIVIAPATAHLLAKMAHGLADDFLSTLLLASTAPVIVAPAMNVNMWNHPATQANIALLRQRGVTIVDPDSGYLACGMTGSGRLADIDTIARTVFAAIAAKPSVMHDLAGETILITAGGTREAIDPVRFLGNRSSGKMGYALAEAARQRGAQVILVSAPTALSPPAGCAFVPVTSAEEMHHAVLEQLPSATIVIGAAAVADFRMASVAADKLRREGALHLELEPTEDILRAVTNARTAADAGSITDAPSIANASSVANPHSRPTLVIAFAAETTNDIVRARAKLLAKGADAIVLNDISQPGLGFDSDSNAATFLTADAAIDLPTSSKLQLAHRLLDHILALRLPSTSELAASELR
jgi:phosphopantothenoylcysteine decarboxylase/phosphopantothenate--cysteine ligase